MRFREIFKSKTNFFIPLLNSIQVHSAYDHRDLISINSSDKREKEWIIDAMLLSLFTK